MSHIVKCTVEMKNKGCLIKAAEALGLECLGEKLHDMWNGQTAQGLGFKLEGWSYPVVIDCEAGEASYDNYNGHWGQQIKLDELVQEYSAQVLQEQALANGYTYERQEAENGDLTLVMEAAY